MFFVTLIQTEVTKRLKACPCFVLNNTLLDTYLKNIARGEGGNTNIKNYYPHKI